MIDGKLGRLQVPWYCVIVILLLNCALLIRRRESHFLRWRLRRILIDLDSRFRRLNTLWLIEELGVHCARTVGGFLSNKKNLKFLHFTNLLLIIFQIDFKHGVVHVLLHIVQGEERIVDTVVTSVTRFVL